MKSSITRRLIIYFLIVLVIFSLISGFAMYFIGKNHMIKTHVSDLMDKTDRISSSITKALDYESKLEKTLDKEVGMMKGMGASMGKMHRSMGKGLGNNYIKWIEEFLLSDVRLVTADSKNISSEKLLAEKNILSLGDLNREEREIARHSLEDGLTDYAYWGLTNKETQIVVSSPLYNSQGNLIGSVLVKEVRNFDQAMLSSAISSLIPAMAIGGLLVFGLAIFFARRFIKPLKVINQSTKELIAGNYDVKTSISQKDEVGSLANNIDDLAFRLAEASQESKRLDQMRDDFVSSMSHELKTPVTVIKSYLEALNTGVISSKEEVSDYHKILYKESEVLERLIFDLMDLNILRNKKFKINKEDLNLIDVVKDAAKSQRLLAKDKNVEILMNLTDNFIDYMGDYTRLRQMFTTIIDNAIKYSSENSSIEIYQKANSIAVVNLGPQIDQNTKAHIFEPFYRNKNNKEKGFGLGLAIAKEIADYHNIEIKIESKEGRNSFELVL